MDLADKRVVALVIGDAVDVVAEEAGEVNEVALELLVALPVGALVATGGESLTATVLLTGRKYFS